MKIKARLKQKITEGEFLYATFDDENFAVGKYCINIMKNTDLFGETYADGRIYMAVVDCDGYSIGYGYESKDADIWDYEIIKE
jgi:hypothetical protein